MAAVLTWIGELLTSIMSISLPWFDLTFGQVLLGPIFIMLLIGVFRIVFTSLSHVGGSVKDD